MFAKALVLLVLSSQAFATLFITSPTVSTTFTGGKEATISWIDSGATAPSLKDFGPSKVSIYAGNSQQQTSLQTISPSVDVSTTSEIKFTVDASIGPNSKEYFVRIESLSFKDPAQPQYPALAFSSKFTLEGMTGVFTAEVLAQIAGQSTAPLASQTAAVTGASTRATASATLTTSKAASSGASGSASAATAKTSKTSAGSLSAKASWAGVVFGAVVGITMF